MMSAMKGVDEKTPDSPRLIPERCGPTVRQACFTGFSLADITRLGFSPIAILCNEAWLPILERLCAVDGYTWEWITEEPEDVIHEYPFYSRAGEAVLTKVPA